MSKRRRISDWASSKRQRIPLHFSRHASSCVLLQSVSAYWRLALVLSWEDHSPRPIELLVLANIAVASIVDDQQMVASSMVHEGRQLHAKLAARVRYGGYSPLVGVVVVFVTEDFLQSYELLLYRCVILPAQQQDRGTGVGGRLLHFAVYQHCSILQVSGKGLKAMPFSCGCRCRCGCGNLSWCSFLYWVVLTRLSGSVLSACDLRGKTTLLIDDSTDLLWRVLGLLGSCRRGRDHDGGGSSWNGSGGGRRWRVWDLGRKPATLVRGVHVDLFTPAAPKARLSVIVSRS